MINVEEIIIRLTTGPSGVFPVGGQLEVQSIDAGQVIVLDGQARVNGKFYWNDDVHTIDIPPPKARTRLDIIAVRLWANDQVVRLVHLIGTYGDKGSGADVPLAMLEVEPSGSIKVHDMRRVLEN
jgi:hypothetical protein